MFKKVFYLFLVFLFVGGVILAACAPECVGGISPGGICLQSQVMPEPTESGFEIATQMAGAAQTQEGFDTLSTPPVELTATQFGPTQEGFDPAKTPTMYVPEVTPTQSGPAILAEDNTTATPWDEDRDGVQILGDAEDHVLEAICVDGQPLVVGGWQIVNVQIPDGTWYTVLFDESLVPEDNIELLDQLSAVRVIPGLFRTDWGQLHTTPNGNSFFGALVDQARIEETNRLLAQVNGVYDYVHLTPRNPGELWSFERRQTDYLLQAKAITGLNNMVYSVVDILTENGLNPFNNLISIGVGGSASRGFVAFGSDADVYIVNKASPVNDPVLIVQVYEVIRQYRYRIVAESGLYGSGLDHLHITMVQKSADNEITDVIQLRIPLNEPVSTDTASVENTTPPVECND